MKRPAGGENGDLAAFVGACGTSATGILWRVSINGGCLPHVAWRANAAADVDSLPAAPYEPRQSRDIPARAPWIEAMKVRNSLKSLRGRHRDNRLVRRKGRLYVINKTQRRFKARQG